MENILSKNNDGSIDVMDRYGFTEYTVGKNEIGIVAKLANKLYEYIIKVYIIKRSYIHIELKIFNMI